MVKVVSVALAVVLAVGCRSRSSAGEAAGDHTPRRPSRSLSFVPGTDVPLPPRQYGFGARDWYALIDSPVNDYLLIGTREGDPHVLALQMRNLMDYYQTAMPQRGWVLLRAYPLRLETEEGDPANWYAMAEDWSKADEEVKLSVSNYAQWHEWGYRLTFTVYGNANVHFDRNSP